MASRTVRLDDEAEAALRQIRETTGLPISEALKRGLRSLLGDVRSEATRTPYDIYCSIFNDSELDGGRGGYAIAPSTETRRGVTDALRKKLNR
jgi:hypothetical protein